MQFTTSASSLRRCDRNVLCTTVRPLRRGHTDPSIQSSSGFTEDGGPTWTQGPTLTLRAGIVSPSQ